MAILVTGAAGFIGYHVANRLLSRGEEVVGIDNLNNYYDRRLKTDRVASLNVYGGQFKFLCLDFSDCEVLNSALIRFKFEHVIHLGAQAGVRYSLENPQAYAQSNLVGHLNMLEFARRRSLRQLVYASSSSVYGSNSSLPFRIDDRVDHPISLYAASKRADELMSEAYAHLFRIPMRGLRFFTVYGPWGRPDMAVWIFARKILAGEPIKLFNNGQMRRDFTYIDDVVDAVVACIDKPLPQDSGPAAGGAPHVIYNIGNSRSEEICRLVRVLESACGRPAEIEYAPLQPGDVADTFADIASAHEDLDFVPAIGIDEGVPKFVQWYRWYSQARNLA